MQANARAIGTASIGGYWGPERGLHPIVPANKAATTNRGADFP